MKLALLILCTFAYLVHFAVSDEMKTIELPLYKRYTKYSPQTLKNQQSEIVPESEAIRRGLTTVEKQITNHLNLQYYSTLFIGENDFQMTFIYDTGSDYLWVPLNNCTQCYTTNLYTPTSTFQTSGNADSIVYGSGSVSGVVATDQISATSGGANLTLTILGIDFESTGLSGLEADGILGMSPSASGNAELYVTKLYENGIIGANAFGVSYRDTTETSKIVLGGYDTSIVTNSSLFTYVPLRDTNYWSLNLKQTKYGTVDLELQAVRGILDTGTSLTLFSNQNGDWDKVYAQISSGGRNCGFSTSSGLRACNCTSDTDFEDITFEFGDYVYYFPRSSYVQVESSQVCTFYISDISAILSTPSVLIGDSFLRNYYVYHDVTNKRVGMYGTATEASAFMIGALTTIVQFMLVII